VGHVSRRCHFLTTIVSNTLHSIVPTAGCRLKLYMLHILLNVACGKRCTAHSGISLRLQLYRLVCSLCHLLVLPPLITSTARGGPFSSRPNIVRWTGFPLLSALFRCNSIPSVVSCVSYTLIPHQLDHLKHLSVIKSDTQGNEDPLYCTRRLCESGHEGAIMLNLIIRGFVISLDILPLSRFDEKRRVEPPASFCRCG
jgi:hypothetical protein